MPYTTDLPLPELTRGDKPWVFAGGIALAGIAGYVNVVSLGVFQVPVSHMTGAVSRLSTDLASGNVGDLVLILGIVVGFFLGAVLSGVIVGANNLLPGRRYGVVLILEGLLLALATALVQKGIVSGIVLAAMACGAQNAMASSYYGLVLRTTHVTGILTDLGVMAGQWLRRRGQEGWKVLLLCSILGGFLAGGLLGQLGLYRLGTGALALAAIACLTAGILYFAWRQRVRIRQS